MKFSIMDFFSKCDQIRSFLRIWSHLLKKSLMKNLIFCAPLRILLVNCWTIVIWAEHKFFSLAIHRWMLIVTHPFLTQPSTSLYPPSHFKSHFFKVSIFPSVQLPEFILYPSSLYTDFLELVWFVFLLFFLYISFSLLFGLTQVPWVIHGAWLCFGFSCSGYVWPYSN